MPHTAPTRKREKFLTNFIKFVESMCCMALMDNAQLDANASIIIDVLSSLSKVVKKEEEEDF